MGGIGRDEVCLDFNGSHKLSLVVGNLSRVACGWAFEAGHAFFCVLPSFFISRTMSPLLFWFVLSLVYILFLRLSRFGHVDDIPPKLKTLVSGGHVVRGCSC